MGTFKNPDVWKQNLAYQIGDFVLYNGTVYMAIKPVPAGTEMSADYWTEFAEGAIVPTGEISITENGEVDVSEYATANVNVEGGGGSSDFTTAHVTVTSDVVVTGNIFQVCTFLERNNTALSIPYPVGSGTTLEFDVILYKGGAGMTVNAVVTATSGAIQEMSVGSYQITGDCTITVVGEPN